MNIEPFFNRLTKNLRHTGRWARKQNITCYRLYDNDMPEFPLAVDVYENIVHVSEYARPHTLTPEEHAAWLAGCMDAISEVTGVSLSLIYMKYRQRQEGLKQYDQFSRIGSEYLVREQGLKFIINPSDYLDTGLFLDHRPMRQMVREAAKGKHVLNLFAYTGSFSVYAAAGGAASTMTIDMSNTYLQWATRNFDLNGFTGPEHRFLQADALRWIREAKYEKFDLIVLDPPTFSNSKRMNGTLDTQRDHVWMINSLLRDWTAPGARIYFSTNYRKFKLDIEAIHARNIQNISKQTVPQDFRNERIHQSFLITK